MKNSIVLSILTVLLAFGCKKDSKQHANELSIEVTGVSSGSYSIVITDNKTSIPIFSVYNKTSNETFKVSVSSGADLTRQVTSTGAYKADFKYNGVSVGGSAAQGQSNISGTIKIP